MQSWKNAHQEITRRIRAGRSGLTRELTAAGLLRILAVLFVGLAAGVMVHLWLRVGTGIAWGITGLIVAVVGVVAARFLFVPLTSRPDEDNFVEWLDERHDANKNIIVTAYQLGRDETSTERFAPDLVGAIIDRGAQAVQGVDVKHWRETKSDRRWWAGLAASLVGIAVLLAAVGPSKVGGAAGKLVDPRRAALEPVAIDVNPGNVTIERGDDVDLAVAISGTDKVPTLRVREAGGIWMTRPMEKTGAADGENGPVHYSGLLRGVERDHEYQVAVKKSETDVWRISVNEPPRVVGFEVTYYYPEYTGKEPETVTGGSGDMAALVGTKVRLKVLANRKMDNAWMNSGPAGAASLDQAMPLDAHNRTNWETRFTIGSEPREFSIQLKDPQGVERFASPRFRIDPIADRSPLVRLLSPDRDLPIPEEMNLAVESEGVDDYGLTRLDLVYSIKNGNDGRVRLKDFKGRLEMHSEVNWDLVPLNLMPGNEVTFYLELFDNDRISGPKSARSEIRRLRFPTMDEIYAEVQDEHQEQIDDLSSVLGNAKELKEELEKLSREAKRDDDVDWEKKKEVESLLEKQKQLEKALEETAKALEETLNKAQEQTLMNPELLQKMQELTELMKSIENENLKDSFEKLSQALQKMDKDAIDKALENFQVDQEAMVKSIDKTIELLKEIRKEEMLEDAVRKAEELAEQQKELAEKIEDEAKDEDAEDPAGDEDKGEESDGEKSDAEKADEESKPDGEKKEGENSDKSQDGEKEEGDDKKSSESSDQEEGQKKASEKDKNLAQEQEALQKKAEDLAKQLEELSELAENEPKLKEELDDIKESGQQQEMQQNMEESEQELSQGQKEKALNFAFKAAKDAENLASQMRSAQKNSDAAKKRELQERMLAVIQDLVDVSSAQEALLAMVPSTREGELAARQKVLIDGTLKAALDLEALGKRTLFVNQDQTSKIGDAMNRMKSATRSYSQGNRNSGFRDGKESAGDLNEAIVELMQSHNSMCQSPSSSGFMESMQKMAGLSEQQQQLNKQMQGMKGQGGKPRLSQGQGEALERMAAQQEAIRRGLQDVAGDLGERKDVLGRLDNLANEMGDVAEELRKHNVDERILERQQKILSRLLDAQRSIRKKEDRNERESKTADQLARQSPGELTPDQLMGPERLRTDILRGQSDKYPPQYRGLVEKYFRALSENRTDEDGSAGGK